MDMNMNMVFSILPELLILCKDEGIETEAYSSVFCAILMQLQLGLFGLSSITYDSLYNIEAESRAVAEGINPMHHTLL